MIFLLLAAAMIQSPATDCRARILDYAHWREAPGQDWDFFWPANDQRPQLTIVGVEHVRDPAHRQFVHLAEQIGMYGQRVAFFEGPDRGVGASEADTIERFGESGIVRFWARGHGLELRSLEPDPASQARALLARFPAERVMLFFLLRQAAQLRERDNVTGAALDSAMTALLQRMRPLAQAAGVAQPIGDLAALQAAVGQYWPGRDWRSFPLAWFSPLADDARTGGIFLAAINRAESGARNRHMFDVILASVRAGERPFVAVGRNHVPMLVPALSCALGGGTTRLP